MTAVIQFNFKSGAKSFNNSKYLRNYNNYYDIVKDLPTVRLTSETKKDK